jgi:hypothetical protein
MNVVAEMSKLAADDKQQAASAGQNADGRGKSVQVDPKFTLGRPCLI